MGRYVGETFNIPLEQGGFCHNKNIDTIAPGDMVHPSKNIWLNEGGVRKRGGTALVDTNIMFTIPDPTHDGSGLDDLSSGTVFTHTGVTTYTIEIDATGTPDTFKWMEIGGSWTTGVAITGSEQTLSKGFKITFAATTGHTLADEWTIAMDAPEVMGLFDFSLANGNQKIVRVTSDGKIWKTNADTIKTGWTVNKLANIIQAEDTIFICNGADKPVSWNGVDAAVTDFTVGVKAQGLITMAGIATVGVAAQGTITMAGIATAYETFVIDDQTFTWKVARVKKGEVKIGATAAEAVVNLAAAINSDMTDVFTADDTSTTVVVVTAVDLEASANTKLFTEASTNMTMDGSGTFGGTTAGVDEETFVIDDQTFTWKTEREDGVGGKGEVTIGATAAAAVTNLVVAINEDMDVVEAVDGAGDTVVLTAKDYSANMNDTVFTEASTNMTMDGSGTFGGTTAGIDDQMPADWTGSNYPTQMILHGRGNSLRNWALGCPLNPKTIYVSLNDDLNNFAQATVLTFYIETGDGTGIVAGAEFGDRLFLFGKTHSFVFNDDSITTSNWGYVGAQWVGGVAHRRLLVETPNDLIAMMANGEIYSVATAEQYGDYKAASITRPSFMHEWIKSYVKLSSVAEFHAIYDPIIRAIKIFVIKSGSSEIDTCLCYFVDRPPEKAWVILDNLSFESGYSASSATLAKLSTGWKIYTGSYNGQVWKLGEVNRNDNNNAFQSCYKTPPLGFDNIRESKRYDRARLVAVREGSCDATLKWWIDGQEKDSEDFEFSSQGGRLGTFVLGSSPLGGVNIMEKDVKIGCLGKRLQLAITNNIANQNFFFSQLLVDFLPLGKGL